MTKATPRPWSSVWRQLQACGAGLRARRFELFIAAWGDTIKRSAASHSSECAMCATTKPRFATIRRLKEAGAPSTSSRIPSPCATSTTAKSEPCSVSTPLRLELAHFLDCVASRRTPLTDGESAVARRSPSKQAPCASAALCVLAFESKPRKPQTPNSKRRSPQQTLRSLRLRVFATLR